MQASPTPPLVVDVRFSNFEDAASSSASDGALLLRIPLPLLSDAVRSGRLDAGRARTVVCVADEAAVAAQVRPSRARAPPPALTFRPTPAQAAVRLRRVFAFDDVAALREDDDEAPLPPPPL